MHPKPKQCEYGYMMRIVQITDTLVSGIQTKKAEMMDRRS